MQEEENLIFFFNDYLEKLVKSFKIETFYYFFFFLFIF
jgi:hypothetical protein